ncbi:hypothetical protein [Diaphorobacter sp.]|uniref:hypothetical protein n=1 Tax=Diaphorobacter sp. TaxID=1934310 RepID=UPI0028ADAE34|nr:hypothetical protein [Diaphorobacter sp.]
MEILYLQTSDGRPGRKSYGNDNLPSFGQLSAGTERLDELFHASTRIATEDEGSILHSLDHQSFNDEDNMTRYEQLLKAATATKIHGVECSMDAFAREHQSKVIFKVAHRHPGICFPRVLIVAGLWQLTSLIHRRLQSQAFLRHHA